MNIQPIETETKPSNLRMTQPQFIEHFNKEGVAMISCIEFYEAIKKGNIEELKEALNERLITSTQFDCNKNTITHYAGSKWEKVIKVTIPKNVSGDYQENKETEQCLQATFGTKDSQKEIIDNIKKVTNEDIFRLWTASSGVHAVWLCFGGGRFVVVAGSWFDGGGYSHRVLSVSAKQSKSKVKK